MIEKYVNTEELRRLLSTLILIVGALMVGALFAVTIVPGLRNANKPSAPMPVNPAVGEPGWLDISEFPAERGKVIPPVDPKTLIEPSTELSARGMDLYELNCRTCHGAQGRGDGPASSGMNPPPRNFTNASGWVNGRGLPAVYKTITEGIRGTSMAAFDYLSKRDRMALAHQVQSLGGFPQEAGSEQAMIELSRSLAAAGEKTPNRIPVSLAVKKLLEEYRSPEPLPAGEESSPEAGILKQVVEDPERAARTLAEPTTWRSSPNDLAAIILPGIPANGFSTKTALLSSAEWQALHAELVKKRPQ